jgi:hypothetical protein
MPAIVNNLDLANQALALLGEMSISALGTAGDKPSLYAEQFVDQAIAETLGMHEWREAIARASISAGAAPTYGASATFSLPAGCLRVLEVNDSTAADSTLPFHIEGSKIVATASQIFVRYISTVAISAAGPLLQQACAARLATKLALPITGSKERMAVMEALFTKTLAEAKAKDIDESPLVRIVSERLGIQPATISPDLLRRLRTFAEDARKEVCRMIYIADSTPLSSLDSLAREAVEIRYSTKVATALSLPSASFLEELFTRRLNEARLRSLKTSVLNNRVLSMTGADLATKDLPETTITELATFPDEARKEVCRMIYVDETTSLASMDTLAQECVDILTARKIATFFSLPSLSEFESLFTKKIQEARVRALQTSVLNGRVLAMIGNDLSTKELSTLILSEFAAMATDAKNEVCRMIYVDETTSLASLDSLAQECVDVNHARKIATFLSLPTLSEFESLFTKKIQEAKARKLQSSALNSRVLSMIGADLTRHDISDTALTELATYAAEARNEILRTGLFSSSLAIVRLTSSLGALGGKPFSYTLPANCMAVVEVSADSAGDTLLDYEIFQNVIAVSDPGSPWIRYISSVDTHLDPLVQSAIDARIAAKASAFFSLPSAPQMEELSARRMMEARKAALNESDLSTQILALVGDDLARGELSRHQIRQFRSFGDEARREVLSMTYSPEETELVDMDVLSQAAQEARHAQKIAAARALPSASAFEELFQRRIMEAKTRKLQTSAINGRILALIGADLITRDISFTTLTELAVNLAEDAKKEILLAHRWNSATKRDDLTATQLPAVDAAYPYTYAIPSDCLRVMEVNGEAYEAGESLYDLEGGLIYAHSPTCWIRYVSDVPLSSLDPLIQNAVDARHAAKICAFLGLPSLSAMEDLARKRLAEARQANSAPRSADNNTIHRALARSRILSSRGYRRNPLRMEDY